MNHSTVRKLKLFFPHQDREQEQWLRAMAQQGLHLKNLNWLGVYTFTKGEPDDVVYRVDFNSDWNKDDYCRLFEDAGWEHRADVVGWQYWRKRAAGGREPEIYTDPESKVAKFRQILLILGMPIAFFILLALIEDPVPTHVVLSLIVFAPLNGYMGIKVLQRMRQLREAS